MTVLFNEGGNQDINLIPKGTLAKVNVYVKGLKLSKQTGGNMLDLEFTITEGQYAKHKVWMFLLSPWHSKNNEEARKMSVPHITRMMESVGFFKEGDKASYAQLAGNLVENSNEDTNIIKVGDLINQKIIGIEIGIQPEKDGYAAKNAVQQFLSSNSKSASRAKWEKLFGASTGGAVIGGFQTNLGVGQTSFQQGTLTPPPQGATPSWLTEPKL